MSGQLVERAGGVRHHEYVIAFGQRGERRKSNTHFCHDAGDDQLFLSRIFNGLNKILIVPSVNLPWAGDVRGRGKLFFQLRNQWAVRASLKTGCQNGRKPKVLSQVTHRQYVVLELVRVNIADQGEQASLMIYHQYRSIVFIESNIGFAHDVLLSGLRRRSAPSSLAPSPLALEKGINLTIVQPGWPE